MTRARKSLAAVLGALLLGALALIWLARYSRIYEKGMPDLLDFGVVAQGAVVEFDVRLLTSARDTPLEQAYATLVARLPDSLAKALAPLDPRKLRGPLQIVDPTKLKPNVAAPGFVRVASIGAHQNTNWFQGRPFVVAELVLDTSRTGVFAGAITASIERRHARLPIRYQVRPPKTPVRTLVTSPFDGSSTEEGGAFRPTVEVLSSIRGTVDYRQSIPPDLAPYRTLLLAETVLTQLTDEQAARVRSAVERGTRVVLACNYFYRGTVLGANKICAGSGIEIIDDEASGEEAATRIEADPLTHGVTNLSFHRGSPIKLDGASAHPLVWAGTNCYAAAAKAGGGEIVVLTQSLWWNWLRQSQRYASNSDARVFLRNILTAP